MTQPAKSQEPSMEEILASIRRIIADDDASKSAQRPPEPPKPAPRPAAPPRIMPEPEREAEPTMQQVAAEPEQLPEPDAEHDQASDILDLTESMTSPALNEDTPATPQFHKIEGFSDVTFDEMEQKPAPVARTDTANLRSGVGDNGLLSKTTAAAVDSAFNTLAQTVLVQNARTLEDLVREMLRPMLKAWLDDNLPSMVERLVRAEIERVARGR
jgi:cell pole-organizing protein PopZ